MESADFVEAADTVERIEKPRVARRQPGRFQIARAQIAIAERSRAISREQMKAQPAAIRARDALRFTKKRDEQEQHEISVNLGLELEIARKIFRADLAGALLKLKRGVQRVIDLFHEGDQRPNIVVVQPGARIVTLELLDQPARIINPDVKPVVGAAQKRACELAQFARRAERPQYSVADRLRGRDQSRVARRASVSEGRPRDRLGRFFSQSRAPSPG